MSELPSISPIPLERPNGFDTADYAAKRDAAIADFQNALRESFDLDSLTC